MVKNYRIVSMSLGVKTIEKAQVVAENYLKWKWNKQFKKGSATEVYELAINIGLPIIQHMLDENKMPLDKDVLVEASLEEIGNPTKPKTSTIAELTDEEIEKLEKEQ